MELASFLAVSDAFDQKEKNKKAISWQVAIASETAFYKRFCNETVFSMIKKKFGNHLRSKNEDAQDNEILCKALCHNICVVIQEMFVLGIEPNFCASDDPAQIMEKKG